MSKIVELKIGEIQNVVGGVNAVSVNLTATASAHPLRAVRRPTLRRTCRCPAAPPAR